MIKNNKGVTLIELLIVIVVMGIIAAFAIPAVGTIITNTQKDAVVADAIAVQNGVQLYCASNQCDVNQTFEDLGDISDYTSGITWGASGYSTTGDATAGTGSYVIKTGNVYTVKLEIAAVNTEAAPGEFEFLEGNPAATNARTLVQEDTN